MNRSDDLELLSPREERNICVAGLFALLFVFALVAIAGGFIGYAIGELR